MNWDISSKGGHAFLKRKRMTVERKIGRKREYRENAISKNEMGK